MELYKRKGKEMSDINQIISEIERVQNVINSTNELLNVHPSHYGEDFTNSMQKNGAKFAIKIWPQLQKSLKSGKPDEVIIGGAVLGAIWGGAYALDFVNNSISKNKAKKILSELYIELSVKQNLLLDEYRKNNKELIKRIKTSDTAYIDLEKRCDALEKQLDKIDKAFKQRSE